MFRALCAHHQEVTIVLYSICYHHTCRWPSGAQVERVLSQPVHGTATYSGRNVAYVSVILVRLFLVIPGLKHCKIKRTATGGADKSLAQPTSR